MNIKFANKGILCALGFITLGAMSVSAFAQSTEYRRGYDQGYRDGVEAQSRQGQPTQQDGPVGRIHIEEARYGVRDAACDAREKVQQMVGWRRNISLIADNELCGDPAPGRQKWLSITFRCGDEAALRTHTREGGTITLNCR
jgi:hypothetical protein